MLNHCGHCGALPPPPRVHFAVAERQPHLEREIRAQEIRKVGAVGAKDHLHLVFAETQMVEQDIARPVAQHLMQRRPRRRRVQRVVEQLLDPCREQVFRRAIPGVAQRPDAARRRARPRRRSARTAMSRVIVPHPAGARSRASVARHVPAAGDLTSANQKYGGPPWRSRDLAATLPSGAISESSPSSGFSAAKTTRKGAPFHGTIGEGRTASSAASSQVPGEPWARESTRREKEGEKCAGDQQQCCRGGSRTGVLETIEPLASLDRN